MNAFNLEINIEGFSESFDLLCSLVENKQFQACDIKIYGIYLVKTSQAPADTLAEFFYMAADLLLEKTKSLLPGKNIASPNSDNTEKISQSEGEFMKSLERYRPYRKSKIFMRENLFIPDENQEREIIIRTSEGGGTYLLAKTWKVLHDRHSQNLRDMHEIHQAQNNADWSSFTETDNQQIEARISELEDALNILHSLSFNELCKIDGSKRKLVITLLALLELCRMGGVICRCPNCREKLRPYYSSQQVLSVNAS